MNITMICGFVIGMALRSAKWRNAECDAIYTNDAQGARRAFTLVESLLGIAIVATLLFLLVPSLGGVRNAARSRVNESNLRQHATAITSYTGDYADAYPLLVYPDATSSVIRCDSADIAVEMPYFVVSRYWNVGLADAYYGGDYRGESFTTPFTRQAYPLTTEYELPCTFLADPRFFAPETRMHLPRQLRAVRSHEVLHPTAKALLVAKCPWENGEERGSFERRHALATADGRAATLPPSGLLVNDYKEPAFDGSIWYSDHTISSLPLAHTRHGVRGRDVK